MRWVRSTIQDWKHGMILASGRHYMWRCTETGNIMLARPSVGEVDKAARFMGVFVNHWFDVDSIKFKGKNVKFINELLYIGEADNPDSALRICRQFDKTVDAKEFYEQFAEHRLPILQAAYTEQYGDK